MMVTVVFLTAVCALSFVAIIYPAYARHRSWPIGSILLSPTGWIATAAFLGLIAAPVTAAITQRWWMLFTVPLTGYIIAYALVMLLRSSVQALAIFGLPLAWIAAILSLTQAIR